MLSLLWAYIQSLLRELRSCKLSSVAKYAYACKQTDRQIQNEESTSLISTSVSPLSTLKSGGRIEAPNSGPEKDMVFSSNIRRG